MSKPTKEEVISALESALTDKQDSAVIIEQKGSWYKIDGGKSLRFSELESMLAEMNGKAAPTAATEAKLVAKTTQSMAAAKKSPATKKADSGNAGSGKTPKALWREKLAGKGQLPRGF